MPNPRTIRAGIIGLGVGEQHLKSYASIEGVKVVAVCDIDPHRLQDVAYRWKVSETYTDFSKVTEHPDIDVVSICSFDDAHADQAVSAFNNGKHVMVEKPVALTRQDAARVLRAQQDSGKWITSNLILRESPRFIEVRDQVRAGAFGEVFHIEGDYVHDILWKITDGWRGKMDTYSIVYGGGIHLIDLMRWILGDEFCEVCAIGSNRRAAGSSYRFDDTVTSLFKFENGASGKCLTTLGPKRTKFHALNVYGSARTFINDIPDAKSFVSDNPDDERVVTTPYPGMKKGDLIPNFIEAIRAGLEPNVSARDVFRIMDVCFAVVESLESKRTEQISYQI